MSKLIQRTAQAEKQVARRQRIMEKYRRIDQAVSDQQQLSAALRNIKLQRRAELDRRRELWEKGDLAPNYDHAWSTRPDTISTDEKRPGYGAISLTRARGAIRVNEEQLDDQCAWAGGARWLCLRPGDRVVVQEGVHKGTIGTIKEIRTENATVVLDGVAQVCSPLPRPLARGEDGSDG